LDCRCPRLPQIGPPAGRGRDELHGRYLIVHLWERFVVDSFRIKLGAHFFQVLDAGLEPLVRGLCRTAGLLAVTVPDVPAQDLPARVKARFRSAFN
jgi:hypothetical protein